MTILISPRWSDWYWIVNDTNKTTKVYSTASNAYVNNNAAAFLTWLADANFGAASNLGSSVTISAAADNGSGKTRLTVESSANFATGQFFYFGANGAQQITVIDGTHVDLTGLAFVSYVATAVMQGASIIDTDANLRKHLNTVALRSNTAGANTVSGAVADIALTNPMALWQTISFAAPGKKIILPAMNAPNSVPIGYPFVITAALGSKQFGIYANDGATLLATLNQGDSVTFVLQDNTANGTFKQYISRITQGTYAVRGLQAQNYVAAPNTAVGGFFNQCILRDVNGSTVLDDGADNNSFFIDLTLAGPIANGRDQAAAFGASQFIHFYQIWGIAVGGAGIASLATPSTNGPTLPTGYTHYAYLFSVYFDAASHLLRVHVCDDEVIYDAPQTALAGGAATVDTAVSVATLVPLNATSFKIVGTSWGVTADATGAAISVLHLGFLAGIDIAAFTTDFAVGPTTATRIPVPELAIPANNARQFYYHHQVLIGSAPSVDILVRSYRVPNGS
jgi:hypothetical protein